MYGHCRTNEHSAHCGRNGYHGFHGFEGASKFGAGFRRPKHNIPANILKTDSAFEIHLYAIGFEKANMKLNLLGNTLHVSGTRELAEGEAPQFTSQEYPIKSFERVFELGKSIEKDHITAKQLNGILVITLPLSPEAQPQGIEVE